MLTTPHVLLGILLAVKFPPIIAFPAAFLSHFIFDFFFPHWNPHLYTEMGKKGKLSKNSLTWILGDGLLAVFFCFAWALAKWPNSTQILLGAICAFLSVAPDLVEIPYYFLKSKNGILKKYIAFEHKYQFNASPFWGILSQLIVIFFSLTILF